MIIKLSKFGGLFFALLCLFNYSSFSQENSCNLKIAVYEYKADGTAEQFPVSDAKIKLVNAKTNKSLKIGPNNTLSNVGGEKTRNFKVTVSKAGFQDEFEMMTVYCELADSQNTVSLIIFLWDVNTKKPVLKNFSGRTEFYTEDPSTNKSDSAPDKLKPESDQKSSDVVNHSAINLVRPPYPRAASAVRASGALNVQVTINELGYVIRAKALDGHPLLRAAAVEAAKASKFRMTYLAGIPVKVTGVIVYNFVP